MNSVVGPIFNESFIEKKRFVGPVNSARDPLDSHRTRISTQKKKNARRRRIGKSAQSKQSLYVQLI